jgi:hypothetical protein
MSRCTKMEGIRVFSPSSTRPDTITNVVYRELLDDTHSTPAPNLTIRPNIKQPVNVNEDGNESDSELSYDDYWSISPAKSGLNAAHHYKIFCNLPYFFAILFFPLSSASLFIIVFPYFSQTHYSNLFFFYKKKIWFIFYVL